MVSRTQKSQILLKSDNFGIDAGRIIVVTKYPRSHPVLFIPDPTFANQINDENRRKLVFVFSNPDML